MELKEFNEYLDDKDRKLTDMIYSYSDNKCYKAQRRLLREIMKKAGEIPFR